MIRKIGLKISAWLLIAMSLHALPSQILTILPAPNQFDPEDHDLLDAVLNLQVFKDSQDKDHYYYLPPFRIFQFNEGAASLIIHQAKIQAIAAAKEILINVNQLRSQGIEDPRLEVYERSITRLENDVLKVETRALRIEERIDQLLERRIDALLLGQEETIAALDQMIANKSADLYNERQTIGQLNDELRASQQELELISSQLLDAEIRQRLRPALTHIASAGIVVSASDYDDNQALQDAIDHALRTIESSYGGFLAVSIYSGFAPNQLDKIRRFKQKYLPNLRLSLLPVNKLDFFPLTEIAKDGRIENAIFRDIQGAGGYDGATLNFDLTLSGAQTLALNLSPFVLPIRISGEINQQINPFKASLNCDFQNGYRVVGRADIRDGLIIYDNDITNNIKAYDQNNGACNLTLHYGDVDSAYFKAFQEMEKQFEAIRLTRTLLSNKEKTAYLDGVLRDLNNNRRDTNYAETPLEEINHWVTLYGESYFVVRTIATAADFHWHTDIQNTANISSIRFNKTLEINGHQKVRMDLPVKLCLTFNHTKGVYDRCNEHQSDGADTIFDARKNAQELFECRLENAPRRCGEDRSSHDVTVIDPLIYPPTTIS